MESHGRSCVKLLLCVLMASIPLAAQDSFEVASVKRTPPEQLGFTKVSKPGELRFTANNVTLQVLIELAFGMDENQIFGLPGFAESDHYDVSAKPEGEIPLTLPQMRPLLQKLLAERLGLQTHRETRQASGYSLELAKEGVKLKPTEKPSNGRNYILPDGIQASAMSMDGLASLLAHPAGHPVVNHTGLEGNFDIQLKYAPETPGGAASDTTLPSLFTAVKEQIGLQLKPIKMPIEVLVVDHIEKIPSGN